jgi:hypothetical protein
MTVAGLQVHVVSERRKYPSHPPVVQRHSDPIIVLVTEPGLALRVAGCFLTSVLCLLRHGGLLSERPLRGTSMSAKTNPLFLPLGLGC